MIYVEEKMNLLNDIVFLKNQLNPTCGSRELKSRGSKFKMAATVTVLGVVMSSV